VDADVASEAVRWMRDQILLQSGTSVLAQVNQQNREALIRLF
jgi:flagellin-like hook-associated protein FlgL